jgi:putative addiction module component (TIGR02574 family)
MSTSIETLQAEVLSLSPADRARLLDILIASLDADPAVEEAWQREAARRDTELESGATEALPFDETLARLRELAR